MSEFTKIEISVRTETAAALGDPHRLEAVARLVDRIVRPSADNDPLAAVLRATVAVAREQGLTDAEIDAEVVVYNAERRRD